MGSNETFEIVCADGWTFGWDPFHGHLTSTYLDYSPKKVWVIKEEHLVAIRELIDMVIGVREMDDDDD